MHAFRSAILAAAITAAAPIARADSGYQGPPFDFSDAFYTANGIDPAAVANRPAGVAPNSIIDNRDNGPNFNNVRILQQNAAYDHSGHPIFFTVTGLASPASFLNSSAGAHALQIAEAYNVFEFPRAANAQFSVFPKAQDLIADLRNGYFSNNPLGIWKVNLVRFTTTATDTPAGQAYLAQLAAINGQNLDGRPLVRTLDQLDDLRSRGYITIESAPAGAAGAIRWFFCPVIKDPRNGVIARDAHLTVTTGIPAADEFTTLFNCLQTTGRDDCSSGHHSDCNHDGHVGVDDIFQYIDWWMSGNPSADWDNSGHIGTDDIFQFLSAWFAGA